MVNCNLVAREYSAVGCMCWALSWGMKRREVIVEGTEEIAADSEAIVEDIEDSGRNCCCSLDMVDCSEPLDYYCYLHSTQLALMQQLVLDYKWVRVAGAR